MKRQKKKYSKPRKPWDQVRIEGEASLIEKYGLKNKKEIWKMESKLRRFRRQARKLIGKRGEEAEEEKEEFMNRLRKLGLVEGEDVEEVLNTNLEEVMDRRLQTFIFKSGMVKTPKQARQAIVHEHILVGERKVTSPSYLVKKEEEDEIKFAPSSPFSNPAHPIRAEAENNG